MPQASLKPWIATITVMAAIPIAVTTPMNAPMAVATFSPISVNASALAVVATAIKPMPAGTLKAMPLYLIFFHDFHVYLHKVKRGCCVGSLPWQPGTANLFGLPDQAFCCSAGLAPALSSNTRKLVTRLMFWLPFLTGIHSTSTCTGSLPRKWASLM